MNVQDGHIILNDEGSVPSAGSQMASWENSRLVESIAFGIDDRSPILLVPITPEDE